MLILGPKQIKAARALAGLTQLQLGKLAGVSFATVNAIERGRTDPRSSTLRAIAQALALAGIEINENGGVRPKR